MAGSEQRNIVRHREAIRELNDVFRKDLSGGRLNATVGFLEHTGGAIFDFLIALAAFNDFSDDNAPYGEHDFGSLTYMGQPVFWKIDYYDLDMKHHSPDPANPDVTIRALWLMMAWEY